jgi:hypothetical protein
MALTEKHRSSIYQKLIPVLGEEEAQALVSQFPARDLDVPATKEFVRAEIAEVHVEIAALRTEMHDLFRRQTVWLVGTMIAMGAVMAAVAGAVAR